MKNTSRNRSLLITLLSIIGMIASLPAATSGTISYTFKTDIREVNSGTGTTHDFLTVEINQPVGPIECRSNVLKVGPDRRLQNRIESLAMSALVNQDQVVITIPLSQGDCIDGSPEILDMYLIHNS